MKLGVFTPVYGSLSTAEMIAKVQSLRHVKAIELGTGGWPGRAHLDDIIEMIDGECRATTAIRCIRTRPSHAQTTSYFARLFALPRRWVVCRPWSLSPAAPATSKERKHPNWITRPWPPEFLEVLDWQWEEKAIPWWT